MKRYYSYLNTAEAIINRYKGDMPLAAFLKHFFSENRKYGSRDRRTISHLCYCVFRFGNRPASMPVADRILTGLFLCTNTSSELLTFFKPDWNNKVHLSVTEKLEILQLNGAIVFPAADQLSDGIDRGTFMLSHFIQPDLFLRLRPGNEAAVITKLQEAGIGFRRLSPDCVALPNSSAIEHVIQLNKEAVVQDYSSQQIGAFYNSLSFQSDRKPITVWDCCAASGGKSILAYDRLRDIDLTVSDIRKSVLVNLEKRFAAAGIRRYHSFLADLSVPGRLPVSPSFDLIISDVPCSGSGTWGRTPEQLYYFNPESIARFLTLQKKIVSTVVPHLRPGGYLLYSTCSVYRQENEAVVNFLQQAFSLQVLSCQLITGYQQKADTMFAAVLQKPSEV